MAKQCADITPSGIRQRYLVDLLYMIVTSMRGIAAKLDSDTSVTDTDYNANLDAVMNLIVENSTGSRVQVVTGESSTLPPVVRITPIAFDKARFCDLLYMIYDAWETLCEQLDADANPATNRTYEANTYTAKFLHMVENSRGNTLGNSAGWPDGTPYYFRLGSFDQRQVVDALYNIVDAIETFCEQADTDAAPADSNYEALWFTANITLTVENSQGSKVGN
uniref:Uncharacterized protein n=1 Tax=viral metagenome TaxID=1070528 RepID=A0A6M3XT98_9ZZZZ